MANPLQLGMVSFQKGAIITVEGKKADQFFIIRTGMVRINRGVKVEEEMGNNILNPGDFFGVVSTMSGHLHIETAEAVQDVTLITVKMEQYSLLIERNTPVAMKIINGFSKRVRELDQALTRMTFKNSAEADPHHLYHVGEYYAKQSHFNHAFYAYYKYLKNCPQGENAAAAKERLAKIKPYAKNVPYLEIKETDGFVRKYDKETMIFSEGEPGGELYIIQQGNVRITKIVDNNEVMLAILKPGDIFGEMALLENKPRSASAIAHEDCVMMAVNRGNFKAMVVDQPKVISRLTVLLAERIWNLYKQLANTLINDPVGRMYDTLIIELEKKKMNPEERKSYTFDLGPKELVNVVGLNPAEGRVTLEKMFAENKFRVIDNKIHTNDTSEIKRSADYYLKMEKMKQARDKGRR